MLNRWKNSCLLMWPPSAMLVKPATKGSPKLNALHEPRSQARETLQGGGPGAVQKVPHAADKSGERCAHANLQTAAIPLTTIAIILVGSCYETLYRNYRELQTRWLW